MILFDATFNGELPALNEIITASKSHYGQYNKMKAAHGGLIKWQLKSKARGFKTLTEKVDVNIAWYTKNEKKDPDVQNLILKKSTYSKRLKQGQILLLKCRARDHNGDRCPNMYTAVYEKKQEVYPNFCEIHRNAFKRHQFQRRESA